MYSENEVKSATLEYFNGDTLATDVWMKKYALKNKNDEYLEKTPDDMHRRLASEFHRVESKYPFPLTEEEIFSALKDFKHIVPQGSPMSGIGNIYSKQSLSNCVVVASPEDNMSSIFDKGKELANLFKNRCVSNESFVITKDKGIVKVKDVVIGDEILSFDIENKKDVYKKILNIFDTVVDEEDRLIITTKSGKVIRTSKKHPILTFNISKNDYEYKRAEELKISDVVLSPDYNPNELINIQSTNEEKNNIAWFIGTHLGDGNSGKVKCGYRMRITSADKEQIEKYKQIHGKLSNSDCLVYKSSRKDFAVDVWEYTSNKGINEEIIKKYFDGQTNNKTYNCFIPSFITDDVFLSFIAGIVDADGNTKDGNLQIALASEKMIGDICLRLDKYGINFNVASYKSYDKNEKQRFRLTIYGKTINDEIKRKMVVPRKKDLLSSFSKRPFVISDKEVDNIRSEFFESKIIRKPNISVQMSTIKHDRFVTESKLELFESHNLNSLSKRIIFKREKIKSISKDITTKKYTDFEVEDTNNFYCGENGFINIHNCGVGMDMSKLRPEGTPVNNSAKTSTGAWSFCDLYSNITRMIGQNNRRGALMLTMDIRHPDIFKFVTMKHDLTKVTGANISVKISDEFMNAVKEDKNFILRFPVTIPSNEKMDMEYNVRYNFDDGMRIKIKAKELWKVITESATQTAEPGILMWDNILRRLPAESYNDFKTICTNPCGEIPLSANDSCRLISVNLSNFIENEFTDKSSFDFEKFKSVVSVAMRLSDDLIDLELEKLDKIYNTVDDESEKIIWKRMIDSATNGRRTGLGTHGLADALTKLQLSYGSPDSLIFIDKLYSTFKNTAYDTSVELSNERGSFPSYDNKIDYCEFFDDLESDVIERMKKYGRRNISILTNAPTGSVSILSQTSSGIEPVFRNFYERRRKLTTDDKVEADFTDANGDKFQQYKVYHHNVKRFIEKHGEALPSYFVESQDLDWKKRVAVQSIIQKHIDHSISSTINLPKGTTSDIVEQIYMSGWEEGLKGITVYVDGSRDGVLITEKKDKFLVREYTKRPDVLDCDIHHKIVDGERYIVMIGLLDGRPYEVFAGKEEKIQIPRKYEKGKIIKREYKTRPNEYDLSIDGGLVKDIVTTFNNPDNSSLGRMISLSLRYGSKIPHVVEQLLQTSEDSSMTCFSKVLARVLKQYIPDGTKAEKGVCPECGQNSLIYKDGCVQCSQCAWSKCS